MLHVIRMLRWSVLALTVLVLVGMSGGVGAQQTPGVTANEIVLGAFIAQSGALAGVGTPVFRGASAYYNYVNDTLGGINGRKIKFIACDDAFDPTKTVACVKKLVEEDKVFAIVNSLGTVPHAAVMDYLVANNVPVVSPHANYTPFSKPVKSNYFAIQPSNETFGTALARYAVQRFKAKKVAILYVDDAFGQELLGVAVAELKRNKLDPVLTVLHPGAETAFRPYVVKLQGANPDAVILLTYLTQSASVLKEAEAVGFKPKWLATNVQADIRMVSLAGASAVEGLVVTGFAADPALTNHSGAAKFRAILRKYFPGEVPSGFSEIAYIGAMQVVEGFFRAGPNLTRERFVQALETFTNWNWDDGLVPPITYARDDRRGITTLYMTKFEKGTMVFVENFSADPLAEPVGKVACIISAFSITEFDTAKRRVKVEWNYSGELKNSTITWGDGTPPELVTRAEAVHEYKTDGGYIAKITGTCGDDQILQTLKINILPQ